MKRLMVLISALMMTGWAYAEINIQKSTDGGTTWEAVSPSSVDENYIGASGEACADTVIPETSDSSTLQQQRRVPFANPGSNPTQQTFLRFINPNATSTRVEVYGIDDDARPTEAERFPLRLARKRPCSLPPRTWRAGTQIKV